MLYAQQNGLKMLDFGLSDTDQPGLLRYKRKFATAEKEISFLEWTPKNFPTRRIPGAGDVLSQMTCLLTDPSVPDEITWRAGEKFYHLFA
jgi:hypothetical protein